MGVALGALLSFGALVACALATAWLEPRLLSGATELGAAAPVAITGDIHPQKSDPWLYIIAPIVALLGACWAVVVIPFSRGLVGADLSIGLFYFLVVVDFLVLAVALGGWGANTTHAVEACYRIVAQLVAYVVPLGLAIIGPIMMARSLSTVRIVEAQAGAGYPYLLVQPLGFALYLVTGLMQAYRAPFLEPFADRIERGVLAVYGGWKIVLWRVALSGLLFVVAAMGAILFLGGYAGPLLPAPVWMLLKTFGLLALMVWGGSRFRLLSTAEMLALAWKILIPVGLLNVLIVGALILFGVGQSPFK